MGIELYRYKEDAEEQTKKLNKESKVIFFVVKVEVFSPKFFAKIMRGKWVDKNVGDPLGDPFGVGKANERVFQKGDIGYLVTTGKDFDGNIFDFTGWGLKKI